LQRTSFNVATRRGKKLKRGRRATVAQANAVQVQGSLLRPIAGSTVEGDSNPDELVHLTVRVRPRTARDQLARTVSELAAKLPAQRRHLSREEHARLYGADPADLDKVKAFASRHGLAVTDSSVARRTVHLLGTVSAVEQALGVDLKTYQHGKTRYRGHAEHATVPAELGPIVEAIVGFDTRPYARPHFQISRAARGDHAAPLAATAFSADQLARIYDFPPDADGTGQVIGIIELASPNGSGFRTSDLDTYFKGLGLSTPDIVAVSVDGGHNQPGNDPNDPLNADGEVALDIEVAAAVAPKAKIVVYFAPNTAQGFMDVINHAVHDSDHDPKVISLSWGSAEDPTDPAANQVNQILQDAASLGVTFCVASGDSGSRDNPNDPDHAAVDFPASSPFALSCGGTALRVSGTKIAQEVVWENHSGGGVSRIFDRPSYQENAKVPAAVNPAGPVRRGVPDVAGDGDPETGYKILVDGQAMTIGGTSAVAPLWAGLVARINQKLGHAAGFINTLLYQNPAAFNDITSGSNIDYNAGAGWDPCTGLGSPKGSAILQALSGSSSSSSTTTAGNPM
jgi:kumamolisin